MQDGEAMWHLKNARLMQLVKYNKGMLYKSAHSASVQAVDMGCAPHAEKIVNVKENEIFIILQKFDIVQRGLPHKLCISWHGCHLNQQSHTVAE